jgi:hypothetical protein
MTLLYSYGEDSMKAKRGMRIKPKSKLNYDEKRLGDKRENLQV